MYRATAHLRVMGAHVRAMIRPPRASGKPQRTQAGRHASEGYAALPNNVAFAAKPQRSSGAKAAHTLAARGKPQKGGGRVRGPDHGKRVAGKRARPGTLSVRRCAPAVLGTDSKRQCGGAKH